MAIGKMNNGGEGRGGMISLTFSKRAGVFVVGDLPSAIRESAEKQSGYGVDADGREVKESYSPEKASVYRKALQEAGIVIAPSVNGVFNGMSVNDTDKNTSILHVYMTDKEDGARYNVQMSAPNDKFASAMSPLVNLVGAVKEGGIKIGDDISIGSFMYKGQNQERYNQLVSVAHGLFEGKELSENRIKYDSREDKMFKLSEAEDKKVEANIKSSTDNELDEAIIKTIRPKAEVKKVRAALAEIASSPEYAYVKQASSDDLPTSDDIPADDKKARSAAKRVDDDIPY